MKYKQSLNVNLQVYNQMKKNNLLLALFVLIVCYLIMQFLLSLKENFDISNVPCTDKPYIKYDNKYFCFDPKTKKHNTLSIFNHGQQMCEIVPNGYKLTLKDPMNDNLEYTTNKQALCNPVEVYVN
jgi:hypothetical protein